MDRNKRELYHVFAVNYQTNEIVCNAVPQIATSRESAVWKALQDIGFEGERDELDVCAKSVMEITEPSSD